MFGNHHCGYSGWSPILLGILCISRHFPEGPVGRNMKLTAYIHLIPILKCFSKLFYVCLARYLGTLFRHTDRYFFLHTKRQREWHLLNNSLSQVFVGLWCWQLTSIIFNYDGLTINRPCLSNCLRESMRVPLVIFWALPEEEEHFMKLSTKKPRWKL
jgi:hypothetical protein